MRDLDARLGLASRVGIPEINIAPSGCNFRLVPNPQHEIPENYAGMRVALRARMTTKAYLNHVSYSLGSHGEVDTLFELIHRRKLVPDPLLSKGGVLLDPIGKMLHGLAESLEARLDTQNA